MVAWSDNSTISRSAWFAATRCPLPRGVQINASTDSVRLRRLGCTKSFGLSRLYEQIVPAGRGIDPQRCAESGGPNCPRSANLRSSLA